MTSSPAAGSRGAHRPAGLVVALGLVLAVAAVALGSVLDAHASSGPLVYRHNAVAASTPATGDVVAPLQRILAGQHRARAPDYDGSVVGSRVAPNTAGVLVEGAGSGTRAISFRPNAADPNWGLTKAHLDKHLFGSGPTSLRQIDPAGNPDLWRNYMQELAGRPATATLKGGIEDVIGTFPRADGGGTFRFGIRIAPGADDTWDLVTLLTKQ